jgi:hypothetical protein
VSASHTGSEELPDTELQIETTDIVVRATIIGQLRFSNYIYLDYCRLVAIRKLRGVIKMFLVTDSARTKLAEILSSEQAKSKNLILYFAGAG